MIDRDRMIKRALSKKVTIDEFNFDHMTAPPIASRFTPTDIGDLHYLATSVKYSSKLQFKYKAIDEIMRRRGCEKFVSGTNRITYRPYESRYFLYKIAFDDVGLKDNPAEFQNQQFLKPFVTKLFDVDPTGTIACVERVNAITNREEFLSVAADIYQAINSWFIGEYVLADFGSKFFMNWGVRENFGPVLLDFPYVYKLDGSKLFCRAKNPLSPTGCCEGEIDYDAGYNELVCKRCGVVYRAKELEKKSKDGTLFIKQIRKGVTKMKGKVSGGSKNIKSEGVAFDGFVQSMPVNTIPANVKIKEAPKEEAKVEEDEAMTVNGAVYSEEDEKEQARKMLKDIADKKSNENIEMEEQELIPGGTGKDGGINVISFEKKEEEKPLIDQIPEFFDKIREFVKDCSDEEKSKVWDLIEALYQDTTAADKAEEKEEETIPGGAGREGGVNVISFEKKEENTIEDLLKKFNDVLYVVEDSDDDNFKRTFFEDPAVLEFIDNNYRCKVETDNYTVEDGIVTANLTISIVSEIAAEDDNVAVVGKCVIMEDKLVIALKDGESEEKANVTEINGKRLAYDKIIMMDAAIINLNEFAQTESKKAIILIDPDTGDYFVTKDGDLIVADTIDDYAFDTLSVVNKDYLANLIELERNMSEGDSEEEAEEDPEEEEESEAEENVISDEEDDVVAEE